MPKDASVYQRANRPKWYVSYFCPKELRRIHKATDFRVDDPTGYKRALRWAQIKSEVSHAFAPVAKKEMWDVWVKQHLESRYRRQPKTLKRYLNAWDWWRVYLTEKKLPTPGSMTYDDVTKFIEWRTKQRRHNGKPITRNTAITDLKAFSIIFGEAVRREFAPKNICERLQLRRDVVAEKPEITDAEHALITRLIAEKEKDLPLTERWMTISFAIAIHHGCRFSETSIAMSAIDFHRKTIRFTAKGKNGAAKVYTNMIHPAILPLLQEIKSAGATHTCTLPVMGSKAWHSFFKDHEELKHLCFHCTRVTVITRLARAGVPIQQAMAYVGHSSHAVHRIYQRLKADDLASCTAALSYTPQKPAPEPSADKP